jgi:Asp-tRNA(Asn)/Glu-tRNA(Gln) amidotransferase A subunit family amidase
MVPLALGTQTGGSLLRPASYCGIHALKPTWNLVSREGVKGSSITQDTVGWYGRSVEDLQLVAEALGALREPAPARRGELRIALCRTPMWDGADAAARGAFDLAATGFRAAGARVEELELPARFARLNDLSRLIMAGEGRTAFAAEYRSDRERLHGDFRAYLEKPVSSLQLCEALDFSAACRTEFDRIAAPFDAVLAPGAAGEAPRLPDKGDSVFQRMWTLLHAPCINLPVSCGPLGLPVGVTLAAGRYADARLLAAAAEFRAG